MNMYAETVPKPSGAHRTVTWGKDTQNKTNTTLKMNRRGRLK